MATHSTILAWKIPSTEEPGALQSIGSQTAGHARGTNTTPFPPYFPGVIRRSLLVQHDNNARAQNQDVLLFL